MIEHILNKLPTINEKYPNLDFDFIFMEETRHDIFNESLTFDFV